MNTRFGRDRWIQEIVGHHGNKLCTSAVVLSSDQSFLFVVKKEKKITEDLEKLSLFYFSYQNKCTDVFLKMQKRENLIKHNI